MEESKKIKYQCGGCHFYDQLEAYATLKTEVSIAYKHQTEIKAIVTKIKDLQTVNKQEFLITQKNITIRLDHIISITAIK